MPLPSAEDIARTLAVHPWTEVPALPGRSNHRRAGIRVPLSLPMSSRLPELPPGRWSWEDLLRRA